MATLSRTDVLKLAALSRLQLTNIEVEQFATEISAILKYIDQLHEQDLGKTLPTFQVTGLTNVMRPDKIIDYGVSQQELLKNAPATEAGQLKVKRMLT